MTPGCVGVAAFVFVLSTGGLARAAATDDYHDAWAGTVRASADFVAVGLRAGAGGFAGPYAASDISGLTRAADAFDAALNRVERTGPPGGYAAYHRELVPVHREIASAMRAVIAGARSRDPVAIEVGWRRLQLHHEEAAELAVLVGSVPQRGRRPIAAAVAAFVALFGAIILVWRARRAVRAGSVVPAGVPAAAEATCDACGAPSLAGARFCASCGAAVGRARRPVRWASAIAAAALVIVAVTAGAVYVAEPEDLLIADPVSPSKSPNSFTPTERPTEPRPTRSSPAPNGLVRYRVIRVQTHLNIRRAPSLEEPVVAKARNGEILTGPGRTKRGSGLVWVAVYLADDDALGWAAGEHLEEIGSGGD